ncbi:MAG: TetR/AcrR family transcriptional regulator [Oligoflexia bacterium]|nr:TetR/AcrR family transcriptional regulator [Oligoflexia bacterium]
MEDSKNPSKSALIEAAQRLFTAKAYEAVSTRELAETAGVNLGAIQYYFGSKAKLFATALHGMMEDGPIAQVYSQLEDEFQSGADAAAALCRFVSTWLQYLVGQEGPHACRCMFREILSQNSDAELFEVIVAEFVENYSRPLSARLQKVILTINPKLSVEELGWTTHSVISQCVFYVTHRPFIEHMRAINLSEPEVLRKIGMHVAGFSLRGLRCEESFIERALAHGFEA